jgi:hypothetical protein
MKTQIELHNVELKGNSFEVFYTIQDADGYADVKMTIKRASVLDHVIENELNVVEYFTADMTDVEQITVHAATWMEENLKEAVKSYLVEQFSLAA